MSTPAHSPARAPDQRIEDAPEENWVDRYAPAAARPYLKLSRADRPIGTWLLLLPCWQSLALAMAADAPGLRDLWFALAFVLGAFLMRGAGCTWNDWADREFDGKVERTKLRPIPSGQVTPKQALIWMGAQMALALLILLTLPRFAQIVSVASLGFVAIYPFMKRYTWWPQLFLGLAFNWGALVGWTAHMHSISAAPLLLYLSGIAWTIHYDTIYAHQDKEDDALIGVKSTARLFGDRTGPALFGFAVAAGLLASLAVALALTGWAQVVAQIAVFLYLLELLAQLGGLDVDDREACLHLFRRNRRAGLILAVGFLAAALVM